MTTETLTKTGTKTFVIQYPVTSYTQVTIERSSDISEEDLLKSVTKDDLVSGYHDQENSWDSLKDSWRESVPGDLFITDEVGDQLFVWPLWGTSSPPFLNPLIKKWLTENWWTTFFPSIRTDTQTHLTGMNMLNMSMTWPVLNWNTKTQWSLMVIEFSHQIC